MSEVLEKKVGGLTVRILRDQCIGTGACCNAAPGLFDLDDRMIVTFAKPGREVSRETVVEVCGYCPVDALVVLGEDGEQIVP